MSHILPVLIPSFVVTIGWIIVLLRPPKLRSRMALLTASLSVFFFSLCIGLVRYRLFGTNLPSNDFVVLQQLTEQLKSAVLIVEVGVAMTVLHLLLAAWVFNRADDCRRSAS